MKTAFSFESTGPIIIAVFMLNSCSKQEWQPTPIPGITMTCKKLNEWSYCINKPENADIKHHLYYFHGRNGNETWWNDSTHHTWKIYSEWIKTKKSPPTVISISFGKLWLLESKENSDGVFDKLMSQVLPEVEKSLGKPKRRGVFGLSMGGMNSLLAGLKAPDYFPRVASMCSPLATISPFSPIKKLYSYITKSSTSWKRAFMLMMFSRYFFKNEMDWKKNDPISLAKDKNLSASPQIYITCGKKDDWGCFKGSLEFVKVFKDRGGQIEWVPREGGHCDIDYPSVAKFLME